MSAPLRPQNHAHDRLVMGRHRRRMPVTTDGTGNPPFPSPIGADIEPKPTAAIHAA